MATGRVFRSCRIIFISLLVLSTALGNRPCKYSCKSNKSLWCQLNAAYANDGLDLSGLPLQDVFTNIFEFGSHVGFGDEGSQSPPSKRKYHRSRICMYGDISNCVTYQLMKDSPVKRISQQETCILTRDQ